MLPSNMFRNKNPDEAGPPRRATSWSEWDRDLHITSLVGWRIMSDAFFEVLSRVGGAALVRATTGLALCLALAAVSHKGAGSVLPAVALVYSMLGTLMLSRGLRAEKHNNPSEAASLYVLALVHYFVSYASSVALAFV